MRQSEVWLTIVAAQASSAPITSLEAAEVVVRTADKLLESWKQRFETPHSEVQMIDWGL
jgi:hypothetical protein